MKNQIEKALGVLLDLPLWNAGRSADVVWFDFGWQRHIQLSRTDGRKVMVGEYVIDTECAWHIAGPTGIVVASRDRLYPAGDPYQDLLNFEWDNQGMNRCDERLSGFMVEHESFPLIVQSVTSNNWGGVNLSLTDGFFLEIFPDDSLDREYWRLYKPHTRGKHFVVTAHGIE